MLDPLLEVHGLGDLAEDVRRTFEELERTRPDCRGLTGEFVPSLDLVETAEAYEVRMDLPGVGLGSIRIFFKRGAIVIAGKKPSETPGPPPCTVQRLERDFGRFARVLRLPGAVDAARARATLRAGELTLVVPKIDERREREIDIPIE